MTFFIFTLNHLIYRSGICDFCSTKKNFLRLADLFHLKNFCNHNTQSKCIFWWFSTEKKDEQDKELFFKIYFNFFFARIFYLFRNRHKVKGRMNEGNETKMWFKCASKELNWREMKLIADGCKRNTFKISWEFVMEKI